MIRIDPEFQSLIPPLEPAELEQLEVNISNDGCRDALTVWQGWLLDGHNRYDICTRRKIAYSTYEIDLPDRDSAKVWVIKNQFGRRNLSAYTRAELALKLEVIIAAKAKENQRKGGNAQKVGRQISDKPLDTKKEVAKAAKVSHDTIAKVKVIDAKAAPEVKAKLRQGETTINREYKRIVAGQKREKEQSDLIEAQAKLSQAARISFSSICDIRHCSMQSLLKSGIEPDCIITDPPYPKEFLPLYGELAALSRKTKLVAVMCGQSYLPEIMADMCKHLTYRWTLAYMTPGAALRQWERNVDCTWKPILLFGATDQYVFDVFRSDSGDKRFHGWGQSESGMADLVSRLTLPGQLICDPFVGGGTTATVALHLGRRFVGCDIDEESVNKSITRCEADYARSKTGT